MDWIIEISEAERTNGALTPAHDVAAHEALSRHGCVILRGVYTEAMIDKLRAAFGQQWDSFSNDQLLFASKREGPTPVLQVGIGRFEVLLDITGAFAEPELIGNRLLREFLETRLDPFMKVSGVTGVISFPGSKSQHIHSDHPALFREPGVSAALPNYAINVAVPLIDVDLQTGPTAIYLGSHLWSTDQTADAEPAITEFKRGDCILIDYRTQHTGMPNTSHTVRPILYIVYVRSWFFDENNHPTRPSLFMSVAQYKVMSEDMQRLLSRAFTQRIRAAFF